jgi:hypothetical protein
VRPARDRRDQHGLALPSPVIVLSVAALVLAAVAFFVTRGNDGDQQVAVRTGTVQSPSVSASAHPSKTTRPTKTHKATPSKPPALDRSTVDVVVYNNTNISGLAGTVGEKVAQAGWHFLAADNWQGTVPATTVYYGDGLKAAATQLGLDLGIKRIVPRDPAATGMLSHGLTIILVGPLG